MNLEPNTWFGVLGGVLAELLNLYNLRQQVPAALPQYLRSGFYWLVTLLMVAAGGALTHVYCASGIDFKPLVAINIGASAPLLIASIARSAPKPPSVD